MQATEARQTFSSEARRRRTSRRCRVWSKNYILAFHACSVCNQCWCKKCWALHRSTGKDKIWLQAEIEEDKDEIFLAFEKRATSQNSNVTRSLAKRIKKDCGKDRIKASEHKFVALNLSALFVSGSWATTILVLARTAAGVNAPDVGV